MTHCHADHTGSLAVLKKETGAPVYMHPLDAALVRRGENMRPVKPAPGLIYSLIYQLFMKRRGPMDIEPAEVEQELQDGDELPFAGGL